MTSVINSLSNTDLAEEIEAINAIYEPDTVTVHFSATSASAATANSTLNLGSSGPGDSLNTTVKLQIPDHPNLSFLLGFHASYPDTPPKILGTASTGARGEGKIAVDVLEDIVGRTYQPGAVCLFDVINEAVEAFRELSLGGHNSSSNTNQDSEKRGC